MATPHYTRRHFLSQQAFGLGGLALNWLLQQDRAQASPTSAASERTSFDLRPRVPSRPPHATAMISMFMQGGPSHLDLFDAKPELAKRHLQNFTGDIKYDDTAGASTKLFASPWKFRKHGQCGMELSELLPCLGAVADDICLIRSMHTGVNNHDQSINALNTGEILSGRLGPVVDISALHPIVDDDPFLPHDKSVAEAAPTLLRQPNQPTRPTRPNVSI